MFRRLGAACPSNYNPADFFVQVLAVVPGRELTCRHAIETTCDAFRRSEYGANIALEAEAVHGEFDDTLKRFKSKNLGQSIYKASWCEQFRAVLWRSWLSVLKEPILIKVRFLQTIVRFSFNINLLYLQKTKRKIKVQICIVICKNMYLMTKIIYILVLFMLFDILFICARE